MSSRRAVDLVKRLSTPAKPGHAGTLDPLATGVLVVCVGAATRWIEYIQQLPKSYIATFLLGRTSKTDDVEAEPVEIPNPPVPTLAEIEAATARFVGTIAQRPPAFSAVKVSGHRAYKLARKGELPELKPRPIVIHRIEVLRYAYPELVLDVSCGSGTYIRSLGRDLAESLGSGAVMSALQRTSIGPFLVENAIDPRELTSENWQQYLQPSRLAVAHLPSVRLTAEQVRRLRLGQPLTIDQNIENDSELFNWYHQSLAAGADTFPLFAAFDTSDELVGVLRFDVAGRLTTIRNMPTEV